MDWLVTLLILIIVFGLLWYLIGIIPLPPPIEKVRWIFYALLIVVAVIVLLGYLPGSHWPK